MGEKKLLIAVEEFTTLRLRCHHCQAFVIFALTDTMPLREARCASCAMLMADAHHLVNKYREFFADLQRFGKTRSATFEVAWRDV
jgi:hypothetical protein